MISLILPPKSQISMTNKMLGDEYGTASNIKSRVNRLSVLQAITSAQQRLKLYNRCPTNGLVLYCGEVMTDDGKIKRVSIDFEPFKPINTSLYLCDNKVRAGARARRPHARSRSAADPLKHPRAREPAAFPLCRRFLFLSRRPH